MYILVVASLLARFNIKSDYGENQATAPFYPKMELLWQKHPESRPHCVCSSSEAPFIFGHSQGFYVLVDILGSHKSFFPIPNINFCGQHLTGQVRVDLLNERAANTG